MVINQFHKCPGKKPQFLLTKPCNGALLKEILLNFVFEIFLVSWREKEVLFGEQHASSTVML